MERWKLRFFSGTRGRIIKLLRPGEATVNELAEALDLTGNAVRAHLSKLERDGLVQQTGKRPGVRKPETLYGLTSEAEHLFPKAYHLLLNRLLDSLDERLPSAEIEALLREVGQRLAVELASTTEHQEHRERAAQAVEVLGDLGGLAELHAEEDRLVIRGCSCPLADAVQQHPQVCQLAEALLTEIIGAPVQERCDRAGRPRCVFHVAV